MNLTVLAAVALAASSCLTGGFSPTSKDPSVWVDSDKHDWGKVPGTETVEHVFKVRNTGGAPLNIARVQTSCGCTAAVLDHQFLKPGEETRLKVTFDPRGRHGSQTRTIWIHSNDPKNPQKQIVIQADIADTLPQATAFPTPQGGPVSGTMMTPSMSSTMASGSAAPMAGAVPAAMAAPAAAPAAPTPTPVKPVTPAPQK
jgi:hypothetical protein